MSVAGYVWGIYTWLGWSGEVAEPIGSSVPIQITIRMKLRIQIRHFWLHGSIATVGLVLLIVEVSRSHKHTAHGRPPLDEWSAWRSDLCLIKHSTQKRHPWLQDHSSENYALDNTPARNYTKSLAWLCSSDISLVYASYIIQGVHEFFFFFNFHISLQRSRLRYYFQIETIQRSKSESFGLRRDLASPAFCPIGNLQNGKAESGQWEACRVLPVH